MVLDRLGAQGAGEALVARLSADQAEAVLLRVVGGLSVAETARIMERPPAPSGCCATGLCASWRPGRRRDRGMTVQHDEMWVDLVQFDRDLADGVWDGTPRDPDAPPGTGTCCR